ncbi:hypothetical protein CAC42_6988 [Sphaceloma murrayae]|uniref:Uncharacterized protein n=1 Tax=Sphaceloma murrayae TaxID=2082308 RepID=A0A2K1QQH0_9PEZI|nr:hypothetical protein CAC42_6988 [Sphaceloma murrayae]
MSTIQLNFTLRVASKSCKTVHLVGSWDNYKQHLPLGRDSSTSKPTFTGSFRFVPPTLLPGSRYWYYYILDAHSVTYDPKHEHVIEPTTGRTLNVLNIPGSPPSSRAPAPSTRDMRPSSGRHRAVPSGRSLSPSQIQHPHPSRPYETQKFSSREMEALSRRYAAQRLADSSSDASSSDDEYGAYGYSSGGTSPVESLSSRSSHNSSPSSASSLSSGECTCERYAVTRGGQRVRVDCGGRVCQGSEDGGCSSESEEERKYRKSHSSHSSSSKKSGKSSSGRVKSRR